MHLDSFRSLISPVVEIEIASEGDSRVGPIVAQPTEAVGKVDRQCVVEDALREGREVIGYVAAHHPFRLAAKRTKGVQWYNWWSS